MTIRGFLLWRSRSSSTRCIRWILVFAGTSLLANSLKRLVTLRQRWDHLAPFAGLVNESPNEEPIRRERDYSLSGMGITDGIRCVLASNSQVRLSATEIAGSLRDGGFDLDRLSNPMGTAYDVRTKTWRRPWFADESCRAASSGRGFAAVAGTCKQRTSGHSLLFRSTLRPHEVRSAL